MFQELYRNYKGLFNSNAFSDERSKSNDDGRPRLSEFFERWGWEYSVGLVVQDTNLTEDDVYGWSVTRYYQKLAYLKDKGKFEIQLNGSR